MRAALNDAGIAPEEVGYVNAHATSTPAGDGNESRAIELVFGEHALSSKLKVSGTKSMTGHLLGGAGGLEAGITVLALQNQMLPPTINLDNVDPECRLDYVPNKAVPHSFDVALSNSFGFGGINATLIMRRWDETVVRDQGTVNRKTARRPDWLRAVVFAPQDRPQLKAAAHPTCTITISAYQPKTAMYPELRLTPATVARPMPISTMHQIVVISMR